ncbi:MAG: hypothetical protein LHV68_09625 [Elusimicrobia bacterium]|nr:hypothetical protein [Candidatus Liberimonas magnetica]
MKKIKQNDIFKFLFGIRQVEIKETCVIIPFFSKDIINELKILEINRGLLYSAGSDDNFSLIITKMGAGFVGDAVLYLKDTKCKKLIFLGSSGAVDKGLAIGDAFLAEKAYSQDSFVNMLLKRKTLDVFYPDKELLSGFSSDIIKGACLSVGSLKLEEEYLDLLKNHKIKVVDMETAAFLAAANYVKKPAVSLLYVTDILKSNPFYGTFKKENMETVRNAARSAAKILYAYIVSQK